MIAGRMSGWFMIIVVLRQAGTGNRIEAFAAPGVAAANTVEAEPRPFKEAVMAKSIDSVARTGRIKTATSRQHRRDQQLVSPDQTHGCPAWQLPHYVIGKPCQLFQIQNLGCI